MKPSQDNERPRIFNLMATHPTLFLIAFPLVCAVMIGWGWTRDGIIEDQVTNIWIPTKGEFAQDLQYAQDLGAAESLGAASFAAMAISRDGGNLFTTDRLEEIRARMEQTEATTVRIAFTSEANGTNIMTRLNTRATLTSGKMSVPQPVGFLTSSLVPG